MKQMKCAVLFLFAICYSNAFAKIQNNAQVINWLVYDLPPYEIINGPFKGQGAADGLRKIVMEQLPQYQHRTPILVNDDRMMRLFEKENVCHTAIIRAPKYESSMYLSIGLIMANTHVIQTTRANYKRNFANQKSTSLDDLLNKTNLKFGRLSRSLGPEIDKVIAVNGDNKNIFLRSSFYTDQGLVKMLFKGRIDYFIDLPSQGMYWNALNPKQQVHMIPIDEVEKKYVVGRVACTKNAWGKKVIEQVNQQMAERRLDPNYINSLVFRWIPEQMREDFISNYKQIIANDNWSNVD